MTFLELTKAAVSASDTTSPATFASFAEGSDFVRQAAEFVEEAWNEIQLLHDGWRFRESEFAMATVPGKHEYRWSELADREGHRSIPDSVGFRRWIGNSEIRYEAYEWLLHAPSNNYVTGTRLPFQNYRDFRRTRLSRSDITRSPSRFSVNQTDLLQFYPTPDDAYLVNGLYVRGVQKLDHENDEPYGIDEEYHHLIKWLAVVKIHGFDEAYHAAVEAKRNYDRLLLSFERKYLPVPKIALAIA